jgi:hypothetical protein
MIRSRWTRGRSEREVDNRVAPGTVQPSYCLTRLSHLLYFTKWFELKYSLIDIGVKSECSKGARSTICGKRGGRSKEIDWNV